MWASFAAASYAGKMVADGIEEIMSLWLLLAVLRLVVGGFDSTSFLFANDFIWKISVDFDRLVQHVY